MADKPLSTEAVALTEKKMDMALDDIIKMSKKNTSKGKRPPPRIPIKKGGFINGNAVPRSYKAQQFMDNRSTIRQGVFAQRRSNNNNNGNQFLMTNQFAKKAAATPVRNWPVNRNRPRVAPVQIQGRRVADEGFSGKEKTGLKQRPQTLDALFASMKKQRTWTKSQKYFNSNNYNSNTNTNNTTTNNNNTNGRQIAQRGGNQWQQFRGRAAFNSQNRPAGNFYR